MDQADNDDDGPICCLIRWWVLKAPCFWHTNARRNRHSPTHTQTRSIIRPDAASPVEGFLYPQLRGCLPPSRLLVYSQQPSISAYVCVVCLCVSRFTQPWTCFHSFLFRHQQSWLSSRASYQRNQEKVWGREWVCVHIYFIDINRIFVTLCWVNTHTHGQKHVESCHTPAVWDNYCNYYRAICLIVTHVHLSCLHLVVWILSQLKPSNCFYN